MNDSREQPEEPAVKTSAQAIDYPAGRRDPVACETTTVRLGAGIGLADLAVETSGCGQYLLLTCRGALLALVGAMGSDVEFVEFADGRSYLVEELLDMVVAA